MSTSYSNFFNSSNNFGINIKKQDTSSQKNIEQHQPQQHKETEEIKSSLTPVDKVVSTVRDVFNGNVTIELNKYRAMNFNTELVLHEADVKVNGQKPTFDMKF